MENAERTHRQGSPYQSFSYTFHISRTIRDFVSNQLPRDQGMMSLRDKTDRITDKPYIDAVEIHRGGGGGRWFKRIWSGDHKSWVPIHN